MGGSCVFALLIVGIAFIVANGLWRLDAFDVGDLDAGRVRAGQWWRVWTALTLHLDGPHLAANTVAGIWFGYLAARLLGTGRAWLLIVLGAGLANWIEAVFAAASHRAVGASTAVFTALGLLSGYSWGTRQAYSQLWALRGGRSSRAWCCSPGPAPAANPSTTRHRMSVSPSTSPHMYWDS